MAHTPGPWTIEYEDEEGELYDDGVVIQSPEGPVAFNVIDCSAELVAAAPDLLAALKAHMPWKKRPAQGWGAWADAAAAIAKAEGRE